MSSEYLAYLSNALVYGTIVVLFVALGAFALDLAVGSGRRRAFQAQRRRIDMKRKSAGGGVATATSSTVDVEVDERYARVGVSLTALAALLATGAVLTRGLAVQRPPWGSMYEFTVTGMAVLLVVWVAMLRRHPEWRDLGVLVTLFALLLMGVAAVVLYTDSVELVPALRSYWIWIHVSAAILSSAVFAVGSLASVAYLVSERYERRAASESSGGMLDVLGARLLSSEQLDKVAYQTIAFAFPLWFFAVVAGAIWAEGAWGRYWGWDPKETWSFITLVIYAAYLHARATAGWRGRRAACIAILGLVAFLFNYFGVNLFIVGLHSYSGT